MPRAVLVGEHELGRRQRVVPGQDRPLAVVEVEHRVDRDEVHVGLPEGVERAHVAPVAVLALRRARHLVVGEVVDLGLAALDEHRDEVAADVVLGRVVPRVLGHDLAQHVGGEHVVAHRRVDLVGGVGQPDRVARLLAEAADRGGRPASVSITPNWSAWSSGARSAATVTPAPLVDVLLDHLARVHAVDVVGAEDDHVVRPLVVEQVEVLVDGVGRAGEPARAAAHLRRHRRHVVAEQRGERPRHRDVAVERVALVLRQHDDPAVAGVDEVGEREVDQAVHAAERHGRLRAVERERREPLALAAGEHHREHVRRGHGHPSSARATMSRASARIRSRCSSPSRLSA